MVNRARAFRDDKEARVQRVKEGKPCADCGVIYPPYVMHFDHVPERGPKVESISQMARNFPWEMIARELEKCDVVCANCHAIRTHERRVPLPISRKDISA